jgi:hypothetical protein
MQQITQNSTPTILILLVSSTDDKTAITGATPTITLSKNGGAFAAATNSAVEISAGFYRLALTATETNTVGPLAVIATATGADVWRDIAQVV